MTTRTLTRHEHDILRAWARGTQLTDIATTSRTNPDTLFDQLHALCSLNRTTARATVLAGTVPASTPTATPPTPPAPKPAHKPATKPTPRRTAKLPRQPLPPGALTPRQQTLLDLVAAGHGNQHIAAQLGIGISTVKRDLRVLYAKLGAKTRTGAVTAAHQPGAPTPATGQPVVTRREHDILRQLTAGHPNKAIAANLHLAPSTVKTHVAALAAKLGTRSRALTVSEALRRGLITAERTSA